MASTTNSHPHMMKPSNTPLYWGIAILAAIIIVLALVMKPARVEAPTTNSPVTIN